jgi:hypothetical protein
MKITLIGYGEVGKILAEDLRRQDLPSPPSTSSCTAKPASRCANTPAARRGAGRIACRRGARRAAGDLGRHRQPGVVVAEACAPGLQPGTFFLDFNSAHPAPRARRRVRQRRRRALCRRRGDDLDPAYRIKVPLLLGGPDAAALEPKLNAYGFAAKAHSDAWAWPAPPRCAAA